MNDFIIQSYTCENDMRAKLIIPKSATKDDLEGIKELLEIVITRQFKGGAE